MPRPILIFSQSGYLFHIVAINLHTWWQTVQIQISWLLKKPTDLELLCLQNRVYPGSAGQGLIKTPVIFLLSVPRLCMCSSSSLSVRRPVFCYYLFLIFLFLCCLGKIMLRNCGISWDLHLYFLFQFYMMYHSPSDPEFSEGFGFVYPLRTPLGILLCGMGVWCVCVEGGGGRGRWGVGWECLAHKANVASKKFCGRHVRLVGGFRWGNMWWHVLFSALYTVTGYLARLLLL